LYTFSEYILTHKISGFTVLVPPKKFALTVWKFIKHRPSDDDKEWHAASSMPHKYRRVI
jgi:hypothetical protein